MRGSWSLLAAPGSARKQRMNGVRRQSVEAGESIRKPDWSWAWSSDDDSSGGEDKPSPSKASNGSTGNGRDRGPPANGSINGTTDSQRSADIITSQKGERNGAPMANGGNGHVASDPADPVPRDGTIALAGGLPESSADEPGNWLVSSVQERRSDLVPRAGSPSMPPSEPSPRGAGLRQRRSSIANDQNVFTMRRDLALVVGEDRVSSGASLLTDSAVYESDRMQQNGDARRKLSTVGALQSPAGPVWTRTGSMASSSVGRLSSAEGVGRSGSLGRASSDGEGRWKEEGGNEAGFVRATSSLAGAGSEFGRLGSLPASVDSEMAERQDSTGQGDGEFAGSRQGLELRHAHHSHAPAGWSPAGRRFRLSKLGASTGSIPTSGASDQGKHDQMHQHAGYPGGGQGGGQGQPFTLTPEVSGGSAAGPTPSDASGQSGSFESEGDEGYSWMAPPVVQKPPEQYAHGSVQHVFTRMASSVGIVQMDETPGQKPKLSNFLQKHSFAGPEQLDNLLSVLRIKCDLDEKETLLDAFTCPVCDAASLESAAACTTTSDQIRAVWEAFRLIDADGDGYITLMDLSDIASWAPDDFGTDFINDLIAELYKQSQGASEYNEDNTPVNGKDFLLAFAHCLKIGEDEDVEEVLEKRAHEYRRIGKLFGLERVQNFFNWRKFWLTFMSDSLAVVALPLCVVLDLLHVTAGTTEDGEKKSLYDLLTESQWLPVGYISYDSFQYYLMKLWMPSLFSVMVYCIWNSSMQVISPSEVLSPIAIYLVIGTYISTISGFEPARLVRRRLNPAISESIKQNELQAIFAFRAHTPEGHLVDQIGAIADVLFATRYRWFSNKASAIAGVVHALMPFVHRMFKWFHGTQGAEFPWWSQVYFWVCGGNSWLHAFVSIPTSAVSGYLTYRLLFITSSGFYNDLAFYYKLRLFRASTQAELFLRLRAAWLRALPKGTSRTEFIQFLNLQKHDDLLLWCRIRQMLVESYSGFKNKQGDVIFHFMLVSVLAYTSHIFFFQSAYSFDQLTVFDLRSRVDVFVFSLLLIVIVRLKLAIHSLRKSDIALLHKEYYTSCIALADQQHHHQPIKMMRGHEASEENSRSNSAAGDYEHGGVMLHKRSSSGLVPGSAHRRSAEDYGDNWHDLDPDAPPPWDRPDMGGRESPAVGGTLGRRGSSVPYTTFSQPVDVSTVAIDERGQGHAAQQSVAAVQALLMHTARYIAEFDKPPQLLSFTINIHFLRYFFIPLLSPIIAAIRSYAFGHTGHAGRNA